MTIRLSFAGWSQAIDRAIREARPIDLDAVRRWFAETNAVLKERLAE